MSQTTVWVIYFSVTFLEMTTFCIFYKRIHRQIACEIERGVWRGADKGAI